MKIVAVIPARYKSTRFPGKPLVDICGKPMIWWVYQEAKKVKDFSAVYVATDDERIVNACNSLGMQAIMTNENNPTGTDRVGEVAQKISAELYVNIQGDEPLLEAETIRAAAPYPKGSVSYDYYKQVCVYGFRAQALKFFYDYGKSYGKAQAELIEDIEILRFIENGYKVQYVEVESDTVAVDTEKDLERVRKFLAQRMKLEM